MGEQQWLDVSDAAKKTNIPAETVRRYIRDHGVHLKIKKSGKYYYVHNEAIDVIKQIRQLYSDGKKKNEIEEALSTAGIPMTITVDHDGERTIVNMAGKILKMEKEIAEQRQQQQQFNEQQQQLLMQLIQELARKHEQNSIESSSHEQVNDVLEKVQETLSEQPENNKRMVNEALTTFQQKQAEIAAASEVQRRDERFREMNTRRKIEGELRQEALRLWAQKPKGERMSDVGWFRKAEDINKRDIFVEEYIVTHFEERLKQAND